MRPAAQRQRYAADRRADAIATLLTMEQGKLVMRFSHPPSLVGDLEHWQYDTFVVRWRDRELRADAFVAMLRLGLEDVYTEVRRRIAGMPDGTTRLVYARGPMGKHTYRIEIDAAGRATSAAIIDFKSDRIAGPAQLTRTADGYRDQLDLIGEFHDADTGKAAAARRNPAEGLRSGRSWRCCASPSTAASVSR